MSRATRGQARRTLALGAVVALGLSLSACGDDDSTVTPDAGATTAGAETSAPAGDDLASKVPDAIKADGKIVVGTDSTYAPSEFLAADGKTIQGFDIDLFNAVAAKLGLKAEFVTASFDAIIPGVQSGKYEIGVSSFTINDERKKVANMVSYFNAGTQWATKAGNPGKIDIDDACGKRIAVQKGTVQVDDLAARSKKCTDAGKKALTVDQYASQADATAAVVTGKDDAVLADSPVVAYAVEQTAGKLELLGDIYDSAPYGYVVKQDQKDFADVLAEALKATIADGSYKTALEKWGVEDGGITDPAVNP
ncbi:MAG TPA: ABC transporter substrate-binding protein [Mycobacteriales bacterium]|nr:ABC transporter substrate-binding protein [Mycobacteriales bacterium]